MWTFRKTAAYSWSFRAENGECLHIPDRRPPAVVLVVTVSDSQMQRQKQRDLVKLPQSSGRSGWMADFNIRDSSSCPLSQTLHEIYFNHDHDLSQIFTIEVEDSLCKALFAKQWKMTYFFVCFVLRTFGSVIYSPWKLSGCTAEGQTKCAHMSLQWTLYFQDVLCQCKTSLSLFCKWLTQSTEGSANGLQKLSLPSLWCRLSYHPVSSV